MKNLKFNFPKKTLEERVRRAFFGWYYEYAFQNLDQQVEPFLKPEIKSYSELEKGRLKEARTALFLSTDSVAKKLGISRQSYNQFEISEANGSISLENLNKMAEAMNCELVYAIRPKNQKPFSSTVWKILSDAAAPYSISPRNLNSLDRSISAIAKNFMASNEFRKKHGWSQRCNQRLD